MRFKPGAAVYLLLLWCFQIQGQETRVIHRSLVQLRDYNDEIRIAGLRTLQTSLDPRIPEACLPLLADEGNSIRRLAARAIGSRYHQIGKERVPDFVQALKGNLAKGTEHRAEGRMAARAIGLLTRDYKGEMFAPSPDGKWVVYERHRLPCLIDVERKNEELLGWRPEFSPPFAPSWNNGPVADSALWHGESAAVALEIIENRKLSLYWFWIADKSELIQLDIEAICRALSIDPDSIARRGGFFISMGRWIKDEFVFEVDLSVAKDPDENELEEITASVAWDLKSRKLREWEGAVSKE